MVNIQKMLENSKKPYLTKLGALEKKKAALLEKIDSEIRSVTAKLESIDSAIEALNGPLAPKIEEAPIEQGMDQEIDPFEIKVDDNE